MHNFEELIETGTEFTLKALNDTFYKILQELQTSSHTPLVKGVQMIQLQKVIFATGMFSIFEAELQNFLDCENGFKEAKKALVEMGETDLADRFNDFYLAINVLKHGKGSSYNNLVDNPKPLPFRLKLPGEDFFNEGDISEVYTLVEVDDNFILNCADLIRRISEILKSYRS
ncbi:hypothetical protein Q4E40_12710 [Pontibacter sp. BT731]|uniref:hypothetical protein n=1 Tax=Pontibacter coccineus TaxID=3063328 RepID=UPI0026E11756|nr:hypothetical protein [Pontibacter sp. BT731]MDO6390995.1 hypothetical protein [Pontibacter sp. BT731]